MSSRLQSPFPWGKAASSGEYSRPPKGGPIKGVGPARGTEEAVKVKPLRSGLPEGVVDELMTLWSVAVGDAAAAMKGGLSLSNQGEAGCGRACA